VSGWPLATSVNLAHLISVLEYFFVKIVVGDCWHYFDVC